MERRKLGSTGREVSAIGLGTWVAGGFGWGGSDERLIAKAIEKALELGIDLIDTAPVYGVGRAEEILGRTLRELGAREQIFLATKCGLAWDEGGRNIRRDSSPDRIRREVEDSLRRLQVDRLDLVQLHWPDPKVPIADSIGALRELQEQGKLAYYGVSNFSAAQLHEALAAGSPAVNQLPYNLFERQIEADALPACRAANVGVLAYGAICRGLLSGKIHEDYVGPRGDVRKIDPKFQKPALLGYLRAVDRLRPMAFARNKTVAQLAVRWLLDREGVHVALWGARTPSQIEECRGVFGWHLTPGEQDGIERILAEETPTPIPMDFLTPP